MSSYAASLHNSFVKGHVYRQRNASFSAKERSQQSVQSVRPLDFQQIPRSMAEGEIMLRFEKSHGNQPPNSTRRPASRQEPVWQKMIERTQGQPLHKGNYALSFQRQYENDLSKRTLDPDLQKPNNQITGCTRKVSERVYEQHFKVNEQAHATP